MTAPRFLIDPAALAGSVVVLTGAQLQHLRARRLRVGSAVALADGHGHQRRGVVATIGRHEAVIHVTDGHLAQRDSPLQLTLAQALLKRDRLDWVIEKSTELGVTDIIVFASERTVRRGTDERHDRWARVARSAAQQCQRSTVPRISGLLSFEHLLAQRRDALRLFLWEEGAPASLLATDRKEQERATAVMAVVGPEGGFSTSEATAAEAAGFHVVSLAPRILRAETAALVATTLCQFLWGDLGASD